MSPSAPLDDGNHEDGEHDDDEASLFLAMGDYIQTRRSIPRPSPARASGSIMRADTAERRSHRIVPASASRRAMPASATAGPC